MTGQRILLLRFSSLGDCILVSGLVEKLHREHPDAELALAIKKTFAGLYENDPRIAMIVFDDQGEHRGLIGLLRYARTVRRWHPALIIDLHGTLRAALLHLLLPRHHWRRLRKSNWRRRWSLISRRFPTPVHVTSRFAAGWSGRLPEQEPALPPRLQVSPASATRSGVLLIPGAAWPSKQWPIAYFADLAERLLSDGQAVTILGGSAEQGFAGHFATLQSRYPTQLAVEFGNLPFPELRTRIATFAVAVANDTGLMHLADAVGVPVIAMYGPTSPVLGFTPQGIRSQVVHLGLACSPCTLHGQRACPRGHHRCLRDLSVTQIHQAVLAILYERFP